MRFPSLGSRTLAAVVFGLVAALPVRADEPQPEWPAAVRHAGDRLRLAKPGSGWMLLAPEPARDLMGTDDAKPRLGAMKGSGFVFLVFIHPSEGEALERWVRVRQAAEIERTRRPSPPALADRLLDRPALTYTTREARGGATLIWRHTVVAHGDVVIDAAGLVRSGSWTPEATELHAAACGELSILPEGEDDLDPEVPEEPASPTDGSPADPPPEEDPSADSPPDAGADPPPGPGAEPAAGVDERRDVPGWIGDAVAWRDDRWVDLRFGFRWTPTKRRAWHVRPAVGGARGFDAEQGSAGPWLRVRVVEAAGRWTPRHDGYARAESAGRTAEPAEVTRLGTRTARRTALRATGTASMGRDAVVVSRRAGDHDLVITITARSLLGAAGRRREQAILDEFTFGRTGVERFAAPEGDFEDRLLGWAMRTDPETWSLRTDGGGTDRGVDWTIEGGHTLLVMAGPLAAADGSARDVWEPIMEATLRAMGSAPTAVEKVGSVTHAGRRGTHWRLVADVPCDVVSFERGGVHWTLVRVTRGGGAPIPVADLLARFRFLD